MATTKAQRPAQSSASSDSGLSIDWSLWEKRPMIAVGDGVLLAHNVDPKTWTVLKKSADPATRKRVETIQEDRKTAASWMLEGRLAPYGGSVRERYADQLRQKVDLQKFISWAVDVIEGPHMPPQFKALRNVLALGPVPHDEASAEHALLVEATGKGSTSSGLTKRLRSMAKLLVAIAIDKYKLDVTPAGQPFALAELHRTAINAGLAMDETAINLGIERAIELVGRDVAIAAISTRTSSSRAKS